jgi:UDP-glucose 4-epimerase
MKHAIITGGAGFIGSHLAEFLLKKGYRVTAIDNLSTGSRENVAHLAGAEEFEFIEADINDAGALTAAARADEIYHLAASVGVKQIMENLVTSILNNIDGTARVLEAAARTGARTLVVSTSEVYGRSANRPSLETDDLRMGEPKKTRWSYACSKALDEYLALAYFYERNLPVTVVRLFNTVGDRQSSAYGMVLPTFVRQALAGQLLTIHGDGRQSRCFVYVKDVVQALYALMKNDKTVGEVYNVGSTEAVTINDLADRVIAATGSRSQKQFIPYEQAYSRGFDDAYRREPDIDKIGEAIGFKPMHLLDDIIKLVIQYERKKLEIGTKQPAAT